MEGGGGSLDPRVLNGRPHPHRRRLARVLAVHCCHQLAAVQLVHREHRIAGARGLPWRILLRPKMTPRLLDVLFYLQTTTQPGYR